MTTDQEITQEHINELEKEIFEAIKRKNEYLGRLEI